MGWYPNANVLAIAVECMADPDQMPVLADACEETGLRNRAILDHLRNPSPLLVEWKGWPVLDALFRWRLEFEGVESLWELEELVSER